jgi:hypothetical protein
VFANKERTKDIPTFEFYINGLIFLVLFDGKTIDITKLNDLDSAFEGYKADGNQRVTGIRKRLELSIETYRGILTNG